MQKFGIEIIHEGSTGTGFYPYFWDNSNGRFLSYTVLSVDNNRPRMRLTSYVEAQQYIELTEGVKLEKSGDYLVPVQPKPVIDIDSDSDGSKITNCQQLIAHWSYHYALRIKGSNGNDKASTRKAEERLFCAIVEDIVFFGNQSLYYGRSESEAVHHVLCVMRDRYQSCKSLKDCNPYKIGSANYLEVYTGYAIYGLFTGLFPA